jgi:Tfp pilus assembly protein PilO
VAGDPELKKKLLLVLVWGLLLLMVYVRFLISPQLEKFSSFSAQTAKVQNQIATLENADEKMLKLQEEYKRDQAKIEEGFSLWVVEKEEGADLLRNLIVLAEDHGVDMVSIREQKDQQGGAQRKRNPSVGGLESARLYHERFIDFQFKCGYHDLGRFINQIEKMRPAFQVVDLSVKSTSGDSAKHAVRLTLKYFVLDSKSHAS